MNLSLLSSISMQNQLVNKRIDNSLSNLSSGLKINKASDDASGLAIADKLRTHASGIKQAIDNANSAVALLQITDKSMNEISNILDTVKQKLIQAHTDTTSNEGRKTIKKDIEKLLSLIDSISEQTNYNGLTLLSHTGLDFQVGDNSSNIIHLKDIYTNLDGLSGVKFVDEPNIDYSNIDINTLTQYYDVKNIKYPNSFTSVNMTENTNPAVTLVTTNINDILSNVIKVESDNRFVNYDIEINSNNFKFSTTDNTKFSNLFIASGSYVYPEDENTKEFFDAYFNSGGGLTTFVDNGGNDKYFYFVMGPNALTSINNYDYDKILTEKQNLKFKLFTELPADSTTFLYNVKVNSIEPLPQRFVIPSIILYDSTPIDTKITNWWYVDPNNLTPIVDNSNQNPCGTLKDLKDLSTENFSFECAGNFQSVVDSSLDILNSYRAEVGSTQNQVESTIRNLMTDYVNTKTAESVIRDVDYSEESTNFTKLNIISQAGSFAQSKNIEVQNRILNLLK